MSEHEQAAGPDRPTPGILVLLLLARLAVGIPLGVLSVADAAEGNFPVPV